MKNKHTDEDDELDFNSDMMSQYDTYEKVEVQAVSTDLSQKAKALIDGIARLYTSTSTMIDEEYVEAIKSVEVDSLVSMLKQVKYSEHMLDSLMNRLDNGGFVDKDLYDQIKDMQHHVIKINLEVSKYTRLLPEFFKFTEVDATSIHASSKQIDYHNDSSNQIVDATFEAVPLNKPQFGTKDFLNTIELQMNSVDHINTILDNEPEMDLDFDPKDAIEEEENFDDHE